MAALKGGGELERRVAALRERVFQSQSPPKPVERLSLPLERVDDVECRDRLAARVFHEGHGVVHDALEKNLEHAARLLVDEARDALHASAARQAADRGLRDAQDVVAHHLAVAASAAHSQAFRAEAAALSAAGAVRRVAATAVGLRRGLRRGRGLRLRHARLGGGLGIRIRGVLLRRSRHFSVEVKIRNVYELKTLNYDPQPRRNSLKTPSLAICASDCLQERSKQKKFNLLKVATGRK